MVSITSLSQWFKFCNKSYQNKIKNSFKFQPNEASFDNRNGVDDLVSNAVVIIFLDKASNLPVSFEIIVCRLFISLVFAVSF